MQCNQDSVDAAKAARALEAASKTIVERGFDERPLDAILRDIDTIPQERIDRIAGCGLECYLALERLHGAVEAALGRDSVSRRDLANLGAAMIQAARALDAAHGLRHSRLEDVELFDEMTGPHGQIGGAV